MFLFLRLPALVFSVPSFHNFPFDRRTFTPSTFLPQQIPMGKYFFFLLKSFPARQHLSISLFFLKKFFFSRSADVRVTRYYSPHPFFCCPSSGVSSGRDSFSPPFSRSPCLLQVQHILFFFRLFRNALLFFFASFGASGSFVLP